MALDFEITQAPCRFGLAEGVEPHQVPFGTLTKAENVCWKKTGLLEKRRGTRALDMTSGPAAGTRIWTRGSEVLVTDDTGYVWAYTSTGWRGRQYLPRFGLTWSTVSDTMLGAKAADVAVVGSTIVTAWVSGDPQSALAAGQGEVYLQTTDLSGRVIQTATAITSTGNSISRVRIVSNGSTYAVLWVNLGNLQSWVGGTTTTLQTDVNNPVIGKYQYNAFDACVIGSNFVVAYAKTGGGIKLRSYSFASTPVLAASGDLSTTTSQGITAISVDGAATDKLYVLFADTVSGDIRYGISDPTTLAVSLVGVPSVAALATMPEANVGVVARPGGGAFLAWSYSTSRGILGYQTVNAAGGLGSLTQQSFCRLVSRPFYIGTDIHMFVTNFVTAAGYRTAGSDLYLISWVGREIGKVESLSAGRWYLGQVCNVVANGSNMLVAVTPFTGDCASNTTPWRQGLRQVSITLGSLRPTDMGRSVGLGPEVYIASTVLTAYDGQNVIPQGFAHPAYLDASVTAQTTGGGMALGAYIYNTAPERRSAAGVLHRGPTGVATTITITGVNNAVSIAATPVNISPFYEPEQVALYRSVVSGSIPQRLSKPPQYMTLQNTPATVLTTTDIDSDAVVGLSKQPAIYTASGELDDFQPPALQTLTVHQNRLWGVGGDGYTLWISKDYLSDPSVAPAFHPSVTMTFTQQVVALASIDDKLVVFGQNAIWIVVGQGPAPNGQGSSYEIIPIPSDVGCSDARSVVVTPDGVMFLSVRGIYMLTRSLELQWVGRPIKDQLATYSTVTSAVLVAKHNEVRFTATGAIPELEGDSRSIVLVYNYVEQQWTTSIYTVGGVYGAVIADACMWNGEWTMLMTDGKVIYETDADAFDTDVSLAQTWVPVTLETAWISATGPLAYQSVANFSFEGIAKSAHVATIEVGFDSETTWPQTASFTVTGADLGLESFDISIGTRRKCRSIRFRFTDAAPVSGAGTGEGLSVSMLGIEVGVKRGFYKKPAEKTG